VGRVVCFLCWVVRVSFSGFAYGSAMSREGLGGVVSNYLKRLS